MGIKMTAKEFQELHGKKKSLRKKSNKEINREMTESFLRQCKEKGFPKPLCEYKLHPNRKWRIDFMFPLRRESGIPLFWLAVEIEGYGHHRIRMFAKDMEKYNELAFAGIRLLRFTVKEVMNGKAVKQMRRLLHSD